MAFVVNPRRRRRSSRSAGRRRRSPGVVYVNGRRGRRRRRSSFRRNPGIGGTIRNVISAAIPAAIGGTITGFVDAKFLGGMPAVARVGSKLVLAAIGGALLRQRPAMASALMGSMIGTAGYEVGVRAGGGAIAVSRVQGIRELAAMAAEDEESLGLLSEELQGMGLLLEEDMGDVEPDLGDAEVKPDLGDASEDDFGEEDDD